MRLSTLFAAALLAPALVSAQVAPPATANTKTLLERMQSNVSRIGPAAEKERWNANIAMWQVLVAKPGKLSASDVSALQTSLETIRTNVATIVRPAEKERWQANVRLWQMFLRGERAMMGPPGGAGSCCTQPMMNMPGRPGVDAAFGRMTLNVAKIPDSAEKDRWQANCDLWEAVLTSQP